MRSFVLLISSAAAFATPAAMGAFTFTNGDVIVGVQATSGFGSDKNVFFNLRSGVYHRDNPGYNNLLGRVEHRAELGAVVTDFTMIRPGALHRANGGYLILDATYYKVRIDGTVRDCATLKAIGIRRDDGKRMILGVSCALSEAEVHWREFLVALKERGIGIPDLVVSDAHTGLKAALRAACNASPWQRCQFHLQQNAQAHVPRLDLRSVVAADIRSIFNCSDLQSAQARLKERVAFYSKSAPKLAAWMEQNLPEGFTVYTLPEPHRRRLRTSNAIERVNQELKRRTRVASLFPNEASLLRLVTALLCEISNEWATSKIYLNMNLTEPPQA